MDKNTIAEDDAQRRIEEALNSLTREQRQGLTASAARNIITDLWPAIVAELRRGPASDSLIQLAVASAAPECANCRHVPHEGRQCGPQPPYGIACGCFDIGRAAAASPA